MRAPTELGREGEGLRDLKTEENVWEGENSLGKHCRVVLRVQMTVVSMKTALWVCFFFQQHSVAWV